MEKKEKKIDLTWEKQGYNMCSEESLRAIGVLFGYTPDLNNDGRFDQWDVPLMEEGECTHFWDMEPCFNKFLNCQIMRHRNIDELCAKIDDGMPTMVRIRPRGNLPGEHHSVVVVGYRIDKKGKRKILVNDPAIGKMIEYSEKKFLKEWREPKNAAMMCNEKEE